MLKEADSIKTKVALELFSPFVPYTVNPGQVLRPVEKTGSPSLGDDSFGQGWPNAGYDRQQLRVSSIYRNIS